MKANIDEVRAAHKGMLVARKQFDDEFEATFDGTESDRARLQRLTLKVELATARFMRLSDPYVRWTGM